MLNHDNHRNPAFAFRHWHPMVFDLLTVVIVYFAALAWGGHEPWAMALIAAGALLSLVAKLIWDSRDGEVRVVRSWVLLALLLFLAYTGLQLLFPRTPLEQSSRILPHTVEPHATLLHWILAIGYFALAVLASHGFRTRGQIKRLLLCLVALGVLEAVYGLIQYLGNYGYIWNFPVSSDTARGTFVNRNHYALLLNLTLSAGIGFLYYRSVRLLRQKKGSLRHVLSSLGFAQLVWIVFWLALIGLALVMSMSRMGIAAMIASIGVMSLAGKTSKKSRRTAAVAFSLLFAVTCLVLYTGIDAVLARYQRMSDGSYLEKDRVPIWSEAVRMIQRNPVTGYGLGTFQWVFGAYEKFEPDIPAQYAHNDYLQALAETGIVGLLILIVAFAASWKTAMANLRLSGDPLVQGIGLATLGALTALALQEVTDFSLYVPGVAACLAVLIGLNIRASRLPGRRERSATVAPAPPREPTRAVPVLVMRLWK